MADKRQTLGGAEAFAHRAIVNWLPLLYLLISSLFFLRTYDSAQVKITVMQMGGLGLLTLWLARLAEAGRHAFSTDDLIALSPFLAFLGWGIFSFLKAPYRMASTDFFIRHLFYMSAALIAIYELDEAAVQKLFRVLIWTAWIAIGYGTLQFVDYQLFRPGPGNGIDPFVWRGAFGPRVFSTYGNPNFYGDFLVIIFPILLTQWLKTRRASLIVLMLMCLLNLAMTGTKGAWLGFAFVCVIFGLITIAFFKERLDAAPPPAWLKGLLVLLVAAGALGVGGYLMYARHLLLGAGFALGGLAFAGVYAAFMTTYTRMIVLLAASSAAGFAGYTAKDLANRVVSINFRLFTWEATWEMIRTQPWTGTGIGSFPPIYPAFRRPPIFHIEGKHNTETDHAENEYLEELFDNGILGFGIFLWLIISTVTVGFRSLGQLTTTAMLKDGRPPPRAYDLIGLMVSFLGMLGHNNFDVSLRFVSSGVYLGLLSGLVVNVARGRALYELHPREAAPALPPGAVEAASPWATVAEMLIWPARLAAIGGILYFAFFIKRTVAGSPQTAPGFVDGMFGEFSMLLGQLMPQMSGGEQLQWWLAWGVFAACMLGLGGVLIRLVLLSENPVVPLLVCAMLQPLYLFWGYFKADVHHNIAIYFSRERKWDAAVGNYLVVNELNPDFVMAKYFLGNVFNDRFDMTKTYNPSWGDKDGQAQDDYERALYWYNEVRRLAPNYVQMHHQVGNLHLRRAQWSLEHGRPDEAQVYLDRALTRFKLYYQVDPVFPPNFQRMAHVYILRKQYDKAVEVLRAYIDAERCAVDPALLGKPWLKNSILSYQQYGVEDGVLAHRHAAPAFPKDSSEAYLNLGNAQFMAERYADAELSYRKSLSYDATNALATKNLQVTYAKANQLHILQKDSVPPSTAVTPGVPVSTGWRVTGKKS